MRDVQQAEERTGGKNKDFDCGNVMGPCIVTADEIGDPYSLRAIARVNGEVWCDNNTRTMDRSFEQVISYMSQAQTLHAGEFLASGTVGTGCGLERDRYLNPGDVVELEVERIGTLRTIIGNRSEQ
jgi:2-keto-4-pentenoate hydratase/2-oxohepta-3-ene-1,7-dioic acid hydratase in catechol pathway